MILEIIKWIDKELNVIADTDIFKSFFDGKELIKGEDTFYLVNKDVGIEIIMPVNYVVDTIHLFSEGYQNNNSFPFPLPFNIQFSFSRNEIQSKLGKPNKSGGGQNALYLGFIPFWDKYYFDGFSIHFRYSADSKSIDMLTLGSLKLEEYFNSEMQ